MYHVFNNNKLFIKQLQTISYSIESDLLSNCSIYEIYWFI